MKLVKWAFIFMLLLVAVIGSDSMATTLKSKRLVGFQLVQIVDGAGGFPAGVWYPTTATPRPTTLLGPLPMDVAPDAAVAGNSLPLIVISHGNGGGPGSHADLAMALAGAGYVVVAPMHNGDNYLDQSAVGSSVWLAQRNRELRLATDYLLHAWPSHDRIDTRRVGAYGFSAGGFTVLVAVGARPDLGLIASHCSQRPEFACHLLREAKSPLLKAGFKEQSSLQADERIRAAVVAAPGLGFSMAGQALAQVNVPVQLWSAAGDAIVPYATNTRIVRNGLGSRTEFHDVAGASHMSFLVPCGLAGPPSLCSETGGFNRQVFHEDMNAKVIGFFDRSLGIASVE